ncbi:MAG: EamA family transporter [archaeon]
MIDWYILAFISAFFSAAAAIYEKKVLFKEKALSFSALFAVINFFLAIPFFFFINYAGLSDLGLTVVLIKSFFEAAAFLCVMMGIKNLELSAALPLLVLTPGLVAIFAFLTLGEALTGLQILGIILLIIGTYTLQVEGKQLKGKKKFDFFRPFKVFANSKGYYYILAALLLFTTTSILDKAILSNFKVSLNAFMGFQHLFLAIIFMLIVIFSGKSSHLKHAFKFSGKLILLISIFTIIYRYTQLSAVKIAPVALVLSIKRISVFFAVLIGGRMFKEHNLIIRTIATAIMVAGAILVILY